MNFTRPILRIGKFVRFSMTQAKSNILKELEHRLLETAASGDTEELRRLIQGSVDVNTKNERGWTPLMFAARNGHAEVIKLLIEKGCDASVLNGSGQSALDIAKFWNHAQAVEVLASGSKSREADKECRNYYSVNPLYRASEQRKNDEWIANTLKKDSTKFVLFSDLKPLLVPAQQKKDRYNLAVFSYHQVVSVMPHKPLVIFLGLETWDPESAAWFALSIAESDCVVFSKVVEGGFFAEPFPVTMRMTDAHAGIFAEAHSILCWHDRYSFCPTCGSTTSIAEAGYKRLCDAAKCRSKKGIHNTCYPRVDPSLIMLVVSPDGQNCLLGRKKTFPAKMYSCLAGFMEPGESIEDTCRREVEEESGVKVDTVEYHSSQPWPFPAVLMLGCVAHAKTTAISPDEDELEDARWFSRAETVQMLAQQHPDGLFVPPAQTIAHMLIKSWVTKTSNL